MRSFKCYLTSVQNTVGRLYYVCFFRQETVNCQFVVHSARPSMQVFSSKINLTISTDFPPSTLGSLTSIFFGRQWALQLESLTRPRANSTWGKWALVPAKSNLTGLDSKRVITILIIMIIHSFSHSCMHSFIHSFIIHSFKHAFIHHGFINTIYIHYNSSFVHIQCLFCFSSFIIIIKKHQHHHHHRHHRQFVHSFIHLFIDSFNH